MTKLKLPPWIQELYGSINKGRLAFRRFRKTIVLEVDPSPSYTRTTAQANVRDTFKQAVEAWKALTPEEKEQYDREASKYNLTGYQYFISQYMKEHLAPPPPLEPAVEITITEQSGTDLTDYQVLLVVNNDPSFFNALGDDPTKLEIRAEDETTLLDFYIEEWDPTNYNAKIWIKIPSIPANGTVKAYIYSNPDRTTPLSDPESVFDFFDDFEGTALDTNKWTQTGGTVTLSNSVISIYSGTAGTKASIYSNATFRYPIILEMRFYIEKGGAGESGHGKGIGLSNEDIETSTKDTALFAWFSGDNKFLTQTANDGTVTNITTTTSFGSWGIGKIEWIDATKVRFYFNDSLVNEHTTNIPDEPIPAIIYSTGLGYIHVDWIRIRKYASPEPSVSYTIL